MGYEDYWDRVVDELITRVRRVLPGKTELRGSVVRGLDGGLTWRPGARPPAMDVVERDVIVQLVRDCRKRMKDLDPATIADEMTEQSKSAAEIVADEVIDQSKDAPEPMAPWTAKLDRGSFGGDWSATDPEPEPELVARREQVERAYAAFVAAIAPPRGEANETLDALLRCLGVHATPEAMKKAKQRAKRRRR